MQNLNYSLFFRVFCIGLATYSSLWSITQDWTTYALMAPYQYKNVGLFRLLNLSFPSIEIIYLLIGIVIFSSFCFCMKPQKLISGCIWFSSLLLLDGFHNMFGFVNAQIHLVWFVSVLTILPVVLKIFRLSPNLQLSFLFLEIIFISVYFQSGIAKFLNSGTAWALEGTTLQFALIRQGIPWSLWLSQFEGLMVLASVVTMGFELLAPIYFLLGRHKPWFWLLSIGFHLVTFMLLGIHFFHLWIFPLCAAISLVINRRTELLRSRLNVLSPFALSLVSLPDTAK